MKKILFVALMSAACGGVVDRNRGLTPGASQSKMSDTRTPSAVTVASAAVASSANAPSPVAPREPFTLRDALDRTIEVYPPVSSAVRTPLVVFLHATCMNPASVCDSLGSAARSTGWLVCPSGNATCAGAPDWHGSGVDKATFLESALSTVHARVATFVEDRPGVLIGWSRGAFAARDILTASHSNKQLLSQRFRGLVLIAAAVSPEAATLRALGITRVVMAAGDLDMSKPVMTAAVKALASGGLEARFVSLGKIGHVWPSDFDARMREPIEWAAEP